MGIGAPPQGYGADLEEALVVYEGQATEDGNKTVLTDVTFKYANATGWYGDLNGNQVIITSGINTGEAREIVATTVNGTFIVSSDFSYNVTAGTMFTITGIRTVPAEISGVIKNQSSIHSEIISLDLNQSAIILNESAIYEANLTHWDSITSNLSAIYANVPTGTGTAANQSIIISDNQTNIANLSIIGSLLPSIIDNQSSIIANITQLATDLNTLNVTSLWTLTDGTEQTLFNISNNAQYYFMGGNINLSNATTPLFKVRVKKVLYSQHELVTTTLTNVTYSEISTSPIVEVDGFPNTYGMSVTLENTNVTNISVFSEWYYTS